MTTDHDMRHAVACECLRQLWQLIDAGGISCGRSRQAVWLETAMELLEYDHRFASGADKDIRKFDEFRSDVLYYFRKEKMAADDKAKGYEVEEVK